MDLYILGEDLRGYIRQFVVVVSWRAEEHWFKLLRRYRSFPFADIPLSKNGVVTENDYFYIYRVRPGHLVRIDKSPGMNVVEMKEDAKIKYLQPLRDYLAEYRMRWIGRVWHPRVDCTLFNVHVTGNMTGSMYRFLLAAQGKSELGEVVEWSGTIPVEVYKWWCFHLTRI